MSKVMKIILIVLLVIVLAVVGAGMYMLSSMRSNAVQTVAKPTEDLSATEEPASIQVISGDPTPSPTPMPIYEEAALDESIINILLIGTDSRSADESENSEGRSDSMILASINTDTGKITLVSFMRDARVHRVGESGRFTFYNKLNGAYRGGYGGGGAGELIKTINGNFGLDIDQYIAIGFDGFATLIDKIGGLDVELDQAEINFINDRIKGDHELEPDIVKNANTVTADPGVVHLDGAQCLIYARNRHTGTDGGEGNDFERVNRQQEIIQLIYKKVTSSMNEQSVLALMSFATNYITTNLDLGTMTTLAKVLLTSNMEFTSSTVPEEGTYKNYVAEKVNSETGETTYEKTDQLEFNIKKAAAALQTLLYGAELTPTPEPTPEP